MSSILNRLTMTCAKPRQKTDWGKCTIDTINSRFYHLAISSFVNLPFFVSTFCSPSLQKCAFLCLSILISDWTKL
jgi:hypothetical protein